MLGLSRKAWLKADQGIKTGTRLMRYHSTFQFIFPYCVLHGSCEVFKTGNVSIYEWIKLLRVDIRFGVALCAFFFDRTQLTFNLLQ